MYYKNIAMLKRKLKYQMDWYFENVKIPCREDNLNMFLELLITEINCMSHSIRLAFDSKLNPVMKHYERVELREFLQDYVISVMNTKKNGR